MPPASATLTEKLDRLGDRLNAVLVKEVRQALRNRRFIGAFMVALVAALLVTFATLSAGTDTDGHLRPQAGKIIFMGIYVCLAIIAAALVPFEAYGRFAADRAQSADDLIQITSLSAWRIVAGKLEAACVMLLLYLSAMAPFSTFAYLLRGVTPSMIAVGLLMTVIAGITAINVVLFVVTLMPKRQGEALALLCCAGIAIALISMGIGMMEALERSVSPDFWLVVGIVVAGFAPFNAVVFTCTASRVAFDAANKETAPRLALLGANVYLVVATVVAWVETGEASVPVEMGIGALAWWAFAGFFLLAVNDEMSDRVKATFPRSAVVGWLLWPGRGRAGAFYLANLVLLCLPAILSFALVGWASVPDDSVFGFLFAVFYCLFFPALPASVFVWLRRRFSWPTNLLKATILFLVIFFAAHAIVEGMAAAYLSYRDYESGLLAPLHALNPVVGTVMTVEGRSQDAQAVWNLVIGGVLMAFVARQFLPAFGRGLAESLKLARARRAKLREASANDPAAAQTPAKATDAKPKVGGT
jgi:hypothetical protein